MGMLTKGAREEEEDPSAGLEEQYERLFNLMARDFLTRGDFITLMRRLMVLVDPQGLFPVDFSEQAWAMAKAIEYKEVLDAGLDGSKIYSGIINLDE